MECFFLLQISTERFNGSVIHTNKMFTLAHVYAHQKSVVKMATLQRLDNGAKKKQYAQK